MERRDIIAGAGGAASLLAGCTGAIDQGSNDESPDGGSGGKYTVSMAPTGGVSFEAPPENVACYFQGYADMVVALNRGETLKSVGVASRYHTDHYAELDGVGIDASSLTELVGDSGIDKELFYELDSDLHLIDPKWLTNNGFFGLDESDVAELSDSVAPFFGNTIFRRTDAWHDYRYYTMYGAFEKVAKVYREEKRFARLKEFHDGYVADVQAKLPPADDRPNALLCFAAENEPTAFSPYRVSDKGTNKKQFHDLGIADALAGTGVEGLSTDDRGQIDYETMLEVDPDSILVRGHEAKTEAEFRDTVLTFMREHDTASKLTAVREGRVFRGGPIYAGPLHNMFLTERFAKNYFPDTFSGKLFDRGAVSAIVTGDA